MEAAEAAAAAAEKPRSILPIMGVILALTVGAAIISSGLEYDTIMKNWDKRRCDLAVMAAARFFKPADDTRTPSQFAKDNFDYCMKTTQNAAIDATLQPAMNMFDAQGKSVKVLKEAHVKAEQTLTNFTNEIVVQIVRDFYQRIEIFGDQLRRTFLGFKSGFKKIQAAVVSSVFMGLALAQGIINFYNLVVLVVIIILSILAALFIILIFVLWPFLPTIVATLAVLSAAGFGGLIGGIGATFCFPGNTYVRMEDGSQKKMEHIKLGERLLGGGVVEGMHVMSGERVRLYKLLGAGAGTGAGTAMPVYVSGDHLVWLEGEKRWGYAREYPGAELGPYDFETVYCPTVSNRCLKVGTIWFRDWEEIPDSAEDAWEEMVNRILNGGLTAGPAEHTREPNGVRWNAEVLINEDDGERVYRSICNVNIGDRILTADGTFTSVLGKTYDMAQDNNGWIFGGSWIWAENMWKHPAKMEHDNAGSEIIAYNLITEAGEFMVFNKKSSARIRDAFEVGLDGMAATYDFTLATLNSSDNSPPITEE